MWKVCRRVEGLFPRFEGFGRGCREVLRALGGFDGGFGGFVPWFGGFLGGFLWCLGGFGGFFFL